RRLLEVQHSQVHRVEQARQGDDGKPDTHTTTSYGWGRNWLHEDHANRVEREPASILEHRVGVRGFIGNWLEHVPVLDDPSIVVEADDVNAGPVPVAGPLLIAVDDDVVAFGDHRLE